MKAVALIALTALSISSSAFAQAKPKSTTPPLAKAFVTAIQSDACKMLPAIETGVPDQDTRFAFRGNGIFSDDGYVLSIVIGLRGGTLSAATDWGFDKTIVLTFLDSGSVYYGHPQWGNLQVNSDDYQRNTVDCGMKTKACLKRVQKLQDVLYQARYKLLSQPEEANDRLLQIACIEAITMAFRNQAEAQASH